MEPPIYSNNNNNKNKNELTFFPLLQVVLSIPHPVVNSQKFPSNVPMEHGDPNNRGIPWIRGVPRKRSASQTLCNPFSIDVFKCLLPSIVRVDFSWFVGNLKPMHGFVQVFPFGSQCWQIFHHGAYVYKHLKRYVTPQKPSPPK